MCARARARINAQKCAPDHPRALVQHCALGGPRAERIETGGTERLAVAARSKLMELKRLQEIARRFACGGGMRDSEVSGARPVACAHAAVTVQRWLRGARCACAGAVDRFHRVRCGFALGAWEGDGFITLYSGEREASVVKRLCAWTYDVLTFSQALR